MAPDAGAFGHGSRWASGHACGGVATDEPRLYARARMLGRRVSHFQEMSRPFSTRRSIL